MPPVKTQWTCSSCCKSFARKGDFTRHSLLHTGYRPHVCSDCGKAFSQFSGLKTHKNVHTKARPYECGVQGCDAAFGDPSSRARHRKETHQCLGVYRCPISYCPTSIKRRSAFIVHLRKHNLDPASIDISALGPSRTQQPAAIVVRSRKQSPPLDFGLLDGFLPPMYSNGTLNVYHDIRPDVPQYYPVSRLPQNLTDTPINNACVSAQYDTMATFEMPSFPTNSLYTIDSQTSPPALAFSSTPSPAPSNSDLIRTPVGVERLLLGDYSSASVLTSSPSLSPPTHSPRVSFSGTLHPICLPKQEQWDLDLSVFVNLSEHGTYV